MCGTWVLLNRTTPDLAAQPPATSREVDEAIERWGRKSGQPAGGDREAPAIDKR